VFGLRERLGRRHEQQAGEQTLPWRASLVYAAFSGGAAHTVRAVSRHSEDVAHLDLPGVRPPAGTAAELQWTAGGLGCHATGTVVAPPATRPDGVLVRLDETVDGIQRRLGVRVETHLAVRVLVPGHPGYDAATVNLSIGGAHIQVDLTGHGPNSTQALAARVRTGKLTVELAFPDQPVAFGCLVAGTGSGISDLRLRFLDIDHKHEEHLSRYLARVQRVIAARRSGLV
jgi:hypothetical protein